MAVLSLRCGAGFSPVAVSSLLIVVVSLVAEHRLCSCGPWAWLLPGQPVGST